MFLKSKKRWAVAAVAVSMMIAPTLVPAGASAESTTDDSTSAVFARQSRSAIAEDYWTEERMMTAIEVEPEALPEEVSARAGRSAALEMSEEGVTGDATEPAYPTPEGRSGRAVVVPATTGKLFYTWGGKNYVCSASTINTAKKNVIMTAAHCVYEAKQGWHSNMTFVPAYYNGQAPYGKWNWSSARTFTDYQTSSAWSHDQAFLTLAPLNGRNIVNVVGGNGLSWGYGKVLSGVRIWQGQFKVRGQAEDLSLGFYLWF